MKRCIKLLLSISLFSLISCGAGHYYSRGVNLDDKGNYDEAVKNYDKAISIDPAFVNAYNDRGVIFKNRKSYREALADFTKVIELNPKLAKAYINRGNCFFKPEKI